MAGGRPIYLDYQATTPCDPRVIAAMQPYFGEVFANPHSRQHQAGRDAAVAIEQARAQIAALIGALPAEIVFTSGATEANNLAIKGTAQFRRARGRHIVTVATEHASVLVPCRALARDGFDVTVLPVDGAGFLELDRLARALRDDTVLVSVMAVNNEIGIIQNLAEIGRCCRAGGVPLHCDAAQAAGLISLDLGRLEIDLMSLSGHKLYGPKGIGALYVRERPRVGLLPLLDGGGQERGLRSGTLPTALIVGFGTAAAIAAAAMPGESKALARLRDMLWRRISAELPGVVLNGDPVRRIAGNLNLRFPGIDATDLMDSLPGVAFASGAACSSDDGAPSHVLRALGLDDRAVSESVRLSVGRFTTDDEIESAAAAILGAIRRLG